MVNDSLKPYSEEMKQIIQQRGDYVIDSYDELRRVVDLAFDNPNSKNTIYFGIIDSQALENIKSDVPNLPNEIQGELFKQGRDYSVAATFDQIRHMVDGKESLTRTDVIDYLDRLADTVLEYDSVAFDYHWKGNNKTAGLLFKKSFSDGVLTSFNLVSHKKKSISMFTLYMDSSSYQKKKSANTLPVQNAPGRTSKTQAGQTSKYTVPQTASKSNKQTVNNSGGSGGMYSLNNSSGAKPANKQEADLRREALDLYRKANSGMNITEGTNLSVGEYIYEKTGWYYDDFGNFVVDHEAPVYLGRSKASDRVMKYAERVQAESDAVRSENA